MAEYLVRYYDDEEFVRLTDDQVRLLAWLENREYLSESVIFIDKRDIENIDLTVS